jgi:hypothetical protein
LITASTTTAATGARGVRITNMEMLSMSDRQAPGRFTPGTIFVFADGYCASADFCGSVLRQVEEILPALWPDVSYTLEALCGSEYWAALSSEWERQEAGRIMVRLVAWGWLLLETVGCRHRNPKRYKLK